MSSIVTDFSPTQLVIGTANETIAGSDNPDFILGTEGNDGIDAGGDADFVFSQAGDDSVQAGAGNDLVLGGTGNDLIAGGSGDDTFAGAGGADRFVFDPSNTEEGQDTIIDFAVGKDLISLDIADILAADPTLPAAAGDPAALEVADFDASDAWGVAASSGGAVSITHPGGTITLVGVPFGDTTDSFAELAGALQLTGGTGA